MKIKISKLSVVLVTSISFSLLLMIHPAQATRGELDPSFGSGGIVSTATYHYVSDIAIQTDGKIVAAGYPLTRYNIDGSIDLTFGIDGKVSPQNYDFAVAVQPDGKIVTVGIAYGIGTNPDFAVARYNPDGSRDLTFGSDGMVLTPFGNDYDYGHSLVIQSDGKIVAAGTSSDGLTARVALVRYDSAGTLDTSFGSGGRVLTQVSTLHDSADSLVIQPDGKLIVGASINNQTSDVLIRYNADGSLDQSFGSGGIVSNVYGGAIAIRSDGKIVAAGRSRSNGSDYAFAMARYHTNGSLDTSFGSAGSVLTPFSTGDARITSVSFQSDGKIIAAGFATDLGVRRFALAKYNANGSVETSFGTGGRVVTRISDNNDSVDAVAVQPDGKIIAAGHVNFIDYGNDDFGSALVRYLDFAAIPAATLSGRVLTPDNRGLRSATVTLTDADGVLRTVMTSSLGYYILDGVSVGKNYTISVSSRRFRYSPRSLDINGNLTNLDFVGVE